MQVIENDKFAKRMRIKYNLQQSQFVKAITETGSEIYILSLFGNQYVHLAKEEDDLTWRIDSEWDFYKELVENNLVISRMSYKVDLYFKEYVYTFFIQPVVEDDIKDDISELYYIQTSDIKLDKEYIPSHSPSYPYSLEGTYFFSGNNRNLLRFYSALFHKEWTSGEYVLYKVDLEKLPNDLKLHQNPFYKNLVYTKEDVPVNALEQIKEDRYFVQYADVIVCVDNEVLMLERTPWGYIQATETGWYIPGGTRKNKEEDLKTLAIRELREETGISAESSDLKHFGTFDLDLCAKTDVYILELDEKPEILISNEHSDYAWVPQSLIESVHTFPRLKEILLKYFKEKE